MFSLISLCFLEGKIFLNKGCCSHQTATLQPPAPWALRDLGIETGCRPFSSQLLQPLWRRLRMKKPRILAPDSWCAYQRNNFIEPRPLPFPIYRKMLNSFTWDIWFSLVNSNFLMFWLPDYCCKTSYVSRLLPFVFRAIRAVKSLNPAMSWV